MEDTPEVKQTNVQLIIDANSAVMSALKDLSQEERLKVISSVSALFGISNSTFRNETGKDQKGPQDTTQNFDKKTSLVEVLKEKNPATNYQRITVFAFYKEKYEGVEQFAKADLLTYFATAKLAKPANYDRDFAEAVKQGWIHEDGANSYLTSSGEAAVSAGFNGKAAARGKNATKAKKGNKSSSAE